MTDKTKDEELFLGYTHKALNEAFKLVANKKDWKARIDRWIDADKLDLVEAAVVYCTGAGLTFVGEHPTKIGRLKVRAVGYRMGSCGP